MSSLQDSLQNRPLNSQEAYRNYISAAQRLTERGNYALADSLYRIAMPLTVYESDSTIILGAIASRAFMYKIQGRFTKSLEGYLRFLDFYSRKSDLNQLVQAYSYLAEYYRAIVDAAMCAKYVYQALDLLEENEIDLKTKAYAYSRAAAFQSQFRGNTDSTIYYSNLALSTAIEADDKFIMALSQNELGFIYMNMDKSDTTTNFGFFRSAMDNFLSEQRYRDYISVLENVARNYYVIGIHEKTILTLSKAISIAEANNWKTYLDGSYLLIAEAYNKVGDHDLSHEYMVKAYYNKIDNLRAEHAIEASELTANFEKDIAQQKLREQQAQTQLAQEQVHANRNALIITIILSTVFLLIAIISVQLYIRFKRKNAQLRTQQDTINKTNAKLSDTLNQKNVLYRELNHRVKNNLTVLSGLIYLQESNETNPSQKEVYETLRQRIQSMAYVHQNLYKFSDSAKINFQEYTSHLVRNLAGAYQGTPVEYSIDCYDFQVEINEAVPLAMVINELITNSFKHAFHLGTKGTIKLSSETTSKARIIHYRDNGPGLSDSERFENPMSLGMRLVKLMIAQLKGKLTYQGDENGVYFKIQLALT